MFARMRYNADKFVKEAEKIRQTSPEKKALSPNKKAAAAPAIVVTPTPAATTNVAPGLKRQQARIKQHCLYQLRNPKNV